MIGIGIKKNRERVGEKSFSGSQLCSQVRKMSPFFPDFNHLYCKQIRKFHLNERNKTSRSGSLGEFLTNRNNFQHCRSTPQYLSILSSGNIFLLSVCFLVSICDKVIVHFFLQDIIYVETNLKRHFKILKLTVLSLKQQAKVLNTILNPAIRKGKLSGQMCVFDSGKLC